MTKNTDPFIVMAAAIDLPDAADAPDWVHLLPTSQGQIATFDGRGPYAVLNAEAVIAASMAEPRGIPVDENHSTNIAAPQGLEAPARGWITAMEARVDGIWGRVNWTKAGRDLVADKAYRAISPVMQLAQDAKTVLRISVASLVNKPNLRGLASLNMESTMDMTKIALALGLGADATEDAILAAIGAIMAKKADTPAMQSALAEIGTVLCVEAGNTAAIVAAVKGKAAEGGALVTLQAENTALSTRLIALETAGKRTASEAFVDAAIAQKRAGLNATTRETYVALHMEQPAVAQHLINAMPQLGASGMTSAPPVGADGTITSLNAEQVAVARQLGISTETYLATLKADRANKEV